MEYWKENDMNFKDMCKDFNKQFPDTPELTYGILRKFYKQNGVKPHQLFNDDNMAVNRFNYNLDKDPIYLNGNLDYIPVNTEENI